MAARLALHIDLRSEVNEKISTIGDLEDIIQCDSVLLHETREISRLKGNYELILSPYEASV